MRAWTRSPVAEVYKPIIRTVHHFACSGGTVISKCIQSMHRTIVISEVNPYRTRYYFNPFDPVQLLIAQTSLNQNDTLKREIFKSRILQCVHIAARNDLNLVFRDHTHSDYCIPKNQEMITKKSSLLDLLSQNFNTKSLVTIRHPLESYLSLKINKWDQAISSSSDYISRLEMMITHYKNKGIPILRYEDFCRNPTKFMQEICGILDLEYCSDFQSSFKKIPMTGDSGRGKKEERVIVEMPPKLIPLELELEASQSEVFKKIASDFDYQL